MKQIAVIGCGFAGLGALEIFWENIENIQITVIDKRDSFHFLPLLPDIIGRRINKEHIMFPLKQVCEAHGAVFRQETVLEIDEPHKKLLCLHNEIPYDYLIICAGSETNFYGKSELSSKAFVLEDANDAAAIAEKIKKNNFQTVIIAGGGYTGIEVATNIRRLIVNNPNQKVIIVEKSGEILGPLPVWMKSFVRENLVSMGIDVLLESSIENIEGTKVNISNGKVFENAAVIWVAGVKTPEFVQKLNCKKNVQGRAYVDPYMRVSERIFAAGDCAYFEYNGTPLRMAVQFASAEARNAAGNIIRSIKGETLVPYKPFDLGYLIPLANNRACGKVFNINVQGILPIWLHYITCVVKIHGMRKKIALALRLLKNIWRN